MWWLYQGKLTILLWWYIVNSDDDMQCKLTILQNMLLVILGILKYEGLVKLLSDFLGAVWTFMCEVEVYYFKFG